MIRKNLIIYVVCIILGGVNPIAYAKEALQVPRFVTLRSNLIKIRVGPGREYPVAWTLKCKGLPVKVIAEYDTWRQVECHDGTTGWIHQGLLSGRRNLLVIKEPCKLWDSKDRDAKPMARLQNGVLATMDKKKCTATYCFVKIGGHSGWIKKEKVWGLLPNE